MKKVLEIHDKDIDVSSFFPEGRFTIEDLKRFVDWLYLEYQACNNEYIFECVNRGYREVEISRYIQRLETDSEMEERVKKEKKALERSFDNMTKQILDSKK